MLFCNLTPLDGRFVNAIVFCRKSELCEYISSLHIQHSIYVRQFEFFLFNMTQNASLFCNVSFTRQYMYTSASTRSYIFYITLLCMHDTTTYKIVAINSNVQ